MDEQFYDSNNYNNPYENPSQEIPVYTPPTPKKREKKNRMGLRICALALGLAIFIVAIFPVGFLMFLVALLLVVCGWGCIRRR